MKNFRQIGALLLAAVMLFTLAVTACAAEDTGFSDVSADDWFCDAVRYCREKGLMDGVGDGRFDPNGSITRAMLATALYRRAGQPDVNGDDGFTDTLDGQWYSSAVLWAVQQGVINGYGDGLFGVNDPVTREQLVTVFWRLAGSPEADSVGGFADSESILPYAVTAVAWARENGIISGKGNNNFDPQGAAIRAEVASMLANDATQSSPKAAEPTSASTVAEWVNGSDLPDTNNETEAQSVFYITAGSNTFEADFAANSSADAFRELLKNGPLTVSMSDYGSFEKVGELGTTLPRNDERIVTEPGDVILYLGSNITIYYDTNTWDFTRLGKIRDVTDLKARLGDGTVEITFSLSKN